MPSLGERVGEHARSLRVVAGSSRRRWSSSVTCDPSRESTARARSRPARADDEQAGRALVPGGRLAVRPVARSASSPVDRRHRRRRAGRNDEPRRTPAPARPTSRRPGATTTPVAADEVDAASASQSTWPESSRSVDDLVAPPEDPLGVERAGQRLGGAGSPRCATASSSGARSRVFDGMHAQNVHSPPSSSRSTMVISGIRIVPRYAEANASPVEPPPRTTTRTRLASARRERARSRPRSRSTTPRARRPAAASSASMRSRRNFALISVRISSPAANSTTRSRSATRTRWSRVRAEAHLDPLRSRVQAGDVLELLRRRSRRRARGSARASTLRLNSAVTPARSL